MLGSTNTWKNNLSEHVPTLSMRMLMQPAGGAPGPSPSRAVAWTIPNVMVSPAAAPLGRPALVPFALESLGRLRTAS